MNSRRTFIERLGKGAAFSSLALNTPFGANAQWLSRNKAKKVFRIGIIGAENSHTAGFGKLFNIEKAYPGMEVKYVWGETKAFAEKAMEQGQIPNRVDNPNDMLGKIDGLIVDHRHAKYHLDPAVPFIEAGIPTFIDKPFCYRAKEGKAFLELAEKLGTPVTSFSSIANSYDTFDIKEQLKTMGEINQVVRYGPVELDSEYGGIFFYGVHTLQPLLYLFGDTVERVRIQNNGKNSTASLVFEDGMMATMVFTTTRGWRTYVENSEGITELNSRLEEKPNPGKNYVDMVHMFKTGETSRSKESIIHCVAVLEALEKSVANEQWEEVKKYGEL
ncbi:Gfo/Idh/MocA family oxidoreductase [Pricia sp. S334]|uniref:Gfo/Idh/MocA family oxidoreductase n=1 Tax=Pricia mediterranea TaxID=3076079 RepID=A0ABU3L4I6_9FLAO|nr:Gfo/Idh/MocA family oxidoreductase [Pricia sp. S334]MDT7828655.1 Gfo/Idh/MocA family oxidoreductase [Pricia sp. S334]